MARRNQRFAGKVVLITGAGGGLGSVQARMFAEQGAAVVLADVSPVRGKAAASAIRKAGGSALFAQLDVTSAASWTRVIERIRRQHGRLHVLVNTAGVVSRTSIRTLPLREWRRVIDVNLTGPMLGTQAAAPLIRESGGGAIVNISSTSGLIGHPGVAYAASKWGLRGVTKSAAMELLDWGIRVNSVHPAQVAGTLMTASATPGYRHANERVMPLKRPSRADEVAQAVLFLASDEASYINATEIVVDGGAVSIGLPRVRALLEDDYNETHVSAQ
jgi:3alpha(or 20beta)-hydroxysteroid dehydrogenase